MQGIIWMPQLKAHRGKHGEATKVSYFLFSYVEAQKVQKLVREMEKK